MDDSKFEMKPITNPEGVEHQCNGCRNKVNCIPCDPRWSETRRGRKRETGRPDGGVSGDTVPASFIICRMG